MKDVLMDGLLDTLKIVPYLFVTFIILEFIEHKLTNNNQKLLSKNKKIGPLVGSILGGLPQCGFSSMAANLFSARVITIGTLIAVFLATSDEMIPIMISEHANGLLILKIVSFKIIIGMLSGLLIDFFYRNKKSDLSNKINDLCEDDHCSCEEEGIFLASIKHTLKISIFILIINLIVGSAFYYVGEEQISSVIVNSKWLIYIVSGMIGLIPNCAGSVIISKLYLTNLISTGALLSGLLPGSGIGILLLFKTNKNIKENFLILGIIYTIGIVIGIIVDLFV